MTWFSHLFHLQHHLLVRHLAWKTSRHWLPMHLSQCSFFVPEEFLLIWLRILNLPSSTDNRNVQKPSSCAFLQHQLKAESWRWWLKEPSTKNCYYFLRIQGYCLCLHWRLFDFCHPRVCSISVSISDSSRWVRKPHRCPWTVDPVAVVTDSIAGTVVDCDGDIDTDAEDDGDGDDEIVVEAKVPGHDLLHLDGVPEARPGYCHLLEMIGQLHRCCLKILKKKFFYFILIIEEAYFFNGLA